MKLNAYFDLREFIPKHVYDEFGAQFCLRFVNPTVLRYSTWIKEMLHAHYGQEVSVRINDWHYGGSFNNRAYRDPKSTVGKWTSTHRLCMATDMDFKFKATGKQIPVKEIYDLILSKEKEAMSFGITRLEDIRDTPTWLHTDCSYTGLDRIQIVRP